MAVADQPQQEWTEESFYFGSAVYPSEATYRRSGGVIHARVEKWIELDGTAKGDSTGSPYVGSAEGLLEFVSTYFDCQFLVHPGYVAVNGGGLYVPPSLYVVGWKDVSSAEGLQQYERDKNDST